MPFARPALTDIITRVEGDYKSGLGLLTLVRRSFLKVFARAQAGLSHLSLGYIAYLEKQAFPDTATDDYLLRWGARYGITLKPATYGQFVLAVTGTAGVQIPDQSIYQRADGTQWYVQGNGSPITLTGVGDTVTLLAAQSGASSAVAIGDQISILNPIAGLQSIGTVQSITTAPTDAEDPEAMRARLIQRIQNPPSGGAPSDYIQWALSIAGITRAWVSPQNAGPGTVTVYVVNDNETPIAPAGGELAGYASAMSAFIPANVGALYTVAPVLDPMTLSLSIKPNTAAIQAAIIASLQDMLVRESQVAGTWAGPGLTNSGVIELSEINSAIQLAAGVTDHSITLLNGGAPANVAPATGHLVTLGAITWATLP